jgi:hypothetical protein
MVLVVVAEAVQEAIWQVAQVPKAFFMYCVFN